MIKEESQLSERTDNFIMLPTVDFCFKELMQNEKVRTGILSALMGKEPEEFEETMLLPTILRKQYSDEKYGVLDVRVLLKNGTQTDLEMQVAQFDFWPNRVLFYLGKMYTDQIKEGESYDKLRKCVHVSILDFLHFPMDDRCYRKISFCDVETGEVYTDLMEIYVLELGKLPPEDKNESGIVRWMRFLSGKCREDFAKMAEKDPYIKEAYKVLENISADDEKRIEYEAREKAIKDYNTQMLSAEKRGVQQGIQKGIREIIMHMHYLQKTPEEIALLTGCDLNTVIDTIKSN